MSGRAQLFVGRLSKDTRVRDLEEVFERYGRLLRCDIKYAGTGMAYAFVDYDDRRDAERVSLVPGGSINPMPTVPFRCPS